jgi:hypothetical protein
VAASGRRPSRLETSSCSTCTSQYPASRHRTHRLHTERNRRAHETSVDTPPGRGGDLADEGTTAPRDCFFGNRAAHGKTLTSDPANIQSPAVDGHPCTGVGNGDSQLLFGELVCAAGFGQCPIPGAAYPQRTGVTVVPLTWQPTMRDPCLQLRANAFCAGPRDAGPHS